MSTNAEVEFSAEHDQRTAEFRDAHAKMYEDPEAYKRVSAEYADWRTSIKELDRRGRETTAFAEEHPELNTPYGRASGDVEGFQTQLIEAEEALDRVRAKGANTPVDPAMQQQQEAEAEDEIVRIKSLLAAAQAKLSAMSADEGV